MVLVLSEERDESTSQVIDWLVSLGKSFFRINQEDNIEILLLDTSNFIILVNKSHEISSQQVNGFWYRRGFFSYPKTKKDFELSDFKLNRDIHSHLALEWEALHFMLHKILEKRQILGGFSNSHLNKIHQLDVANNFEINTPSTLVTTQKGRVNQFIDKHKIIITKSINYALTLNIDGKNYMTYTEKVDERSLKAMPDTFYASLFQEYIEKKYEIRAFYLAGIFYSMAIFSQSNSKTEIDFRKYDQKLPNRCVPFKIPIEVEAKLRRLIQFYKLDTCSVDLIFSHDFKFYFLEINPVGQFGMVSYPCNYFLERKIADFFLQ